MRTASRRETRGADNWQKRKNGLSSSKTSSTQIRWRSRSFSWGYTRLASNTISQKYCIFVRLSMLAWINVCMKMFVWVYMCAFICVFVRRVLQTDRQTYRQTDRPTGRQTHGHKKRLHRYNWDYDIDYEYQYLFFKVGDNYRKTIQEVLFARRYAILHEVWSMCHIQGFKQMTMPLTYE